MIGNEDANITIRQVSDNALNVEDGKFFAFWRFMIRFVIPPILIVALAMGITE